MIPKNYHLEPQLLDLPGTRYTNNFSTTVRIWQNSCSAIRQKFRRLFQYNVDENKAGINRMLITMAKLLASYSSYKISMMTSRHRMLHVVQWIYRIPAQRASYVYLWWLLWYLPELRTNSRVLGKMRNLNTHVTWHQCDFTLPCAMDTRFVIESMIESNVADSLIFGNRHAIFKVIVSKNVWLQREQSLPWHVQSHATCILFMDWIV